MTFIKKLTLVKIIDQIIKETKMKSPETRIAVSKVIVRQEKPIVGKKMEELNKRLDVICHQHNVDMIDN